MKLPGSFPMLRIRNIIAPLLLACCIVLAGTPTFAQDEEENSDFQRQAALFSQHCTKCHTIGKGDRVGPDLKDVTKKRERQWLENFIWKPSRYLDQDPIAKEMLEKFNGVRMTDLGLSTDQVKDLLIYIETVSEGPVFDLGDAAPLSEERIADKVAMPDELTGVWWQGAVLTLAVAGVGVALWVFAWKSVALSLFVLCIGLGYLSFGGRAHHHLPGDNQGYTPAQPIAYSHKLHAGDLNISCLYCHHGAEKGPVAGVPSVNVCMNCHGIVTMDGKSPELQKLYDIWNSRNDPEPKRLEWVRVHNLPSFVSFSHMAHVQNNIQCQECHGPVQTMDVLRQASNLTMGFCVNCHRHDGKPAPTHWKRAEGTLDCVACHQ